VRIERVVLEHHGDVAILGRDRVDHAPADRNLARRDVLETRQHAQQGGFATTGRTHQHHELAIGDVDTYAM
jgi:hypothetical protein